MDHEDPFARASVVQRIGEGTVTADGRREVDPGAASVPDGKYAVEGTIGAGGMGEVLLVRDRDLRRNVAMKVMRREIVADDDHRLRFVAEAQATSQLEHPGIPPVHDLGITEDGAPWFTMKLVRGQTLRDVLHNLLLGRKDYRSSFTLHRLISILERICETLHFANEKGVLHRDLKPENVMLGDYGEVHVMDWGIARVRGETVEPEEQVGTVGTDAGLATLDGAVKGTVPYMSPEQALGRLSVMDRRSDVWALGCLLYEILTLHRVFEGVDVLPRVQRGDVPPVRERNPRRPVPEDLAVLCERCLTVDPHGRPESARAVGDVLRSWLDGSADRERRHAEAEDLVRRGREAVRRHAALREEAALAEQTADRAVGRHQPWQSVGDCLPMLEARAHADALQRRVVKAFAESTRLLEGALLAEEEHAGAREALADLWCGRLVEAEARGDGAEAAFALDMVARWDDGRRRRIVRGEGTLELASNPPGAEVTLHPLEDRHGILREGEGRVIGTTPLHPTTLPMGSWLCVLRHPGLPEVRYPVHIGRNHEWRGTVRMRTAAAVGDGFVHVPEGPFVAGDGDARRVVEVDDFAIAVHPVTFGDWAGFLAAVEEEEGRDAAFERLPRTPEDGPYMERREDGTWWALPNNVEGPARERCEAEHGSDFEMRLPVAGISWFDAVAWCAWKTRITGREWRLPTEAEREKAARGVDGRRFPWGDLEHASLGKCRHSRDEMPQPEPVGAFPTAASVYGMEDAAGNSWDWTDTWYDEREELRVLKGGGWLNAASNLACAFRDGRAPVLRDSAGGFRPARNLR